MSVIKSAQQKSLSGIIKAVKKGANINELSHDGKNALYYAVKAQRILMAKYLIENGINVNTKDNDGKTALYYASEIYDKFSYNHGYSKDSKNIMLYLVENGAKDTHSSFIYKDEYEKYKKSKKLNQAKPLVVTPFKQAKNSILKFSQNRSVKKMKTAFRKGADINEINSLGKNALFHAVNYNSINMVKFLIERGINVNLKDKEGKTVLMSCYNPKILEILIDSGVSINEVDNKGRNALFYKNNPETIKHLIDNSIDVNLQDKNCETTLMLCRCEKSIKILLENGANPNLQNKDGRTSLMNQYKLESIKTLLEKGANPNLKNKYDSTALTIFFEEYTTNKKCPWGNPKNYFDIVLTLLDYEADIDLVQNNKDKNELKKIYNENIVSVRLKKSKERSDLLREELTAKFHSPENIEKWSVYLNKPFDEVIEVM
jgi:ankyrin repeat protein